MTLEIQPVLRVSLLLGLLLSANAAHGQCANKRSSRCADHWARQSDSLSERLQFSEAANAWRSHLKSLPSKPKALDLEKLRLLERAAELQSRSLTTQPLSADEMVELVELIDRFAAEADAIPVAENAVKLYPDSAKALVALAKLIDGTQTDRALELLNRAATLADKEPFVFVARGWFYNWVQFRPFEAEKNFRRALELSNELNASAWQGLGDALSRQGRRQEAIEAYLRYLKIRPSHAAHYDEVIKRDIETLKNLP